MTTLRVFAVFLAASAVILGAAAPQVKTWEEDLTLPTYLAGEPEPNPIFYFGRASQGAQGRVYPYPLYDTLTHRKVDKTYRIVYLENEYVRIGILPEIGGRVFEGFDKTNNYHFFYRQNVIKPALIGLIGAWISGGIEWNIPHHHRASTFLPVQHRVEENADGSKTIWVGELEVRHRMRWAVGHTLRPGRSYMEVSIRILNRTPVVNTMLCWANVATHATHDYQVIFPPRTQWGTHHHKREFTEWPLSKSVYGGYDYSRGVDVSWYRNHVAATSIFAWNYEDDFVAGYDHGKQAGTMSVANHHTVPGKKLWTWGVGPRGRMWDQILTDDDGPYVELMVGAYSDNQPDYTWLQPYEVKSFEQYFYPFRDIGGVKNATLDAAVNLEVGNGEAKLGFYTTAAHPAATVLLKAGDRVLLEEKADISPARAYVKRVTVPAGIDQHDLRASISSRGRELVAYTPVRLVPEPMPEPVRPPPAPKDIKTNEELYLAGLRIEQFHNPNLDPEPYWEEALRRDPGDARVNTALGINYFKKARFAESEKLFRRALERLTDRHTTPKDAEATYYLGLALKAQGRADDAFSAFYRATWSFAWRAPSYYSLSEIACGRGDFNAALELAERSLEANALNVRALTLKAAALRRLGRPKDAIETLAAAHRKADPLDVRVMAERWLAGRAPADAKAMAAAMNEHPATAAETAAEYLNAGLWQDGLDVLSRAVEAAPAKTGISPVVYYYMGHFAARLGLEQQARRHRALAGEMLPDYVFPFQYEVIGVLREAMEADPRDARALYYLGNLLFDWQPETAVKMWEAAAALDPRFAIVHRNLGLAYSRQKGGSALDKAIASLEKAVSLDRKFPLHYFELDQLYEAAGTPVEKRLAVLERNHEIVAKRDDALSRSVSLKVIAGKYEEAIRLMTGRRFSVWEGGSLNVAEFWTEAHFLRGHERLTAKRYEEALEDYKAALRIPDNLPSERRGTGGREAEANYWMGLAYEGLGDLPQARKSWTAAAAGSPAQGRRGAAGESGIRGAPQYYQALALRRLGQAGKAAEIFRDLVKYGSDALQYAAAIDFFASFDEQQNQRVRLAAAHFAAGLGYLGLDEKVKASEHLNQVFRASPDHVGARRILAELGK